MSQKILTHTQQFRDILGCPFNISLHPDALVRFDGWKGSEHYVIVNQETKKIEKYSNAVDGFPDCDIFDAWTMALSSNLFGGVGVYFDTWNNEGEPQPMLHLDTGPFPSIWCRIDEVYYRPHTDENFFKRLRCEFEKI